MKRLTLNICLLIMVLFSFSACSTQEGANTDSDSEAKNKGTTDEEEITLIWASDNPGRFEVAKEAIEEKFPHITIEFYNANTNRESIQEMLAAQVHPDI